MRRLFWLALGATAGVLVMRQATRAAQALSPAGLSQSLGGALGELTETVRDFADEVGAGMVERESELRAELGLDGTHDAVDAHTVDVRQPVERGRT